MVGALIKRRILYGNRLGDLGAVQELGLEAFRHKALEDEAHQQECDNQKNPLLLFHYFGDTKKRTAFSLAICTSIEWKTRLLKLSVPC